MRASKYIITTYTPGMTVNTNFIKTLKRYCCKNSARLLILTTKTIDSDAILSNEIDTRNIVTIDKSLNDNLLVKVLPVSPTCANPIAGLTSLSHGELSVIVAGNKQVLKHLPSYSGVRLIASTGSCCAREYGDSLAAAKAASEHILGALIVEIENKQVFHLRNIIANKDGEFFDIGCKYTPQGAKYVGIDSLVAGDIHAEESDPKVIDLLCKFGKKHSIRQLFLHDIHSGSGVTHHIAGDVVLQSKINNEMTLENSLDKCVSIVNQMANNYKHVFVVASNHDAHTEDWLREGRFVSDKINLKTGAFLFNKLVNDFLSPLQAWFQHRKAANNVIFLEENMNLMAGKYIVSKHGHAGTNGSRALPKGIRSLTGHTHSAEIKQDGSIVVGHSCDVSKVNYLSGASSWSQSFAIVHEDGFAQLINLVGHKFQNKGEK